MVDINGALNTVWQALGKYREDCISEEDEMHDAEWDDICLAMAVIEEELGIGKPYEQRVQALEDEGLTRSDAQGVVDAEILKEHHENLLRIS